MQRNDWIGVMPAITTPFNESGDIDIAFMRRHARQMIEAGSTAMVTPGSLGEGGTLTPRGEGHHLVGTLGGTVGACAGGRCDQCAVHDGSRRTGSNGGGQRMQGTDGPSTICLRRSVGKRPGPTSRRSSKPPPLSCMLYNNPLAYTTDIVPEQVLEMAGAHANLHAVKESSGDIRRIAELRRLLGDRLAIFAGIDDLVVEAVDAGADGWIAGPRQRTAGRKR